MATSVRRVALFGIPALAILGLAVGMRVGGRRSAHGAIVYGAPRSRGSDVLLWQVVTVLDDRGVRESVRLANVTVRIRGESSGRESTWTGATNEDGVAEVRLDASGMKPNEPTTIEVRAASLEAPLAEGHVAWGDDAWLIDAGSPFVRAAKNDGDVRVDVAPIGNALVAGEPTTLAVRTTTRDGAPIANVALDADPENGLDMKPPHASTCPIGWSRFAASPGLNVASVAIHARAADGHVGEWYGSLPVVPGAMSATLDASPKAGAPFAIRVRAGSERIAYVEIDDDVGRAFAIAQPVPMTPIGAEAHVDVPALPAGVHWLVASSEPRGAEKLAGATIARPFVIAGDAPLDPCHALEESALHPAGGFARFVAIDGFVAHGARASARRDLGMRIALTSLGIGALVEMILVIDAFLRARRDVKHAAATLSSDDAALVTPRANPLGLVVGLFAVAFGFAILAGLLFLRL